MSDNKSILNLKDWKQFEIFSLKWIRSNMKNCKSYLWVTKYSIVV